MAIDWQPIETALEDEKNPILVFYDHDADTYILPDNPAKLTDYAANAESGTFCSGQGICMAVWRDGYEASDGWEAANSYWIPGCWFAYLDRDATDYAVNPILWAEVDMPTTHKGEEE